MGALGQYSALESGVATDERRVAMSWCVACAGAREGLRTVNAGCRWRCVDGTVVWSMCKHVCTRIRCGRTCARALGPASAKRCDVSGVWLHAQVLRGAGTWQRASVVHRTLVELDAHDAKHEE